MTALPSTLDLILTSAARAGRDQVQALGDSEGAAQARAAVEQFADRSGELLTRYATGQMTAEAAARAAESEAEALTFTLAAIVQENKRQWFEQLLTGALRLVSSLLTGPR